MFPNPRCTVSLEGEETWMHTERKDNAETQREGSSSQAKDSGQFMDCRRANPADTQRLQYQPPDWEKQTSLIQITQAIERVNSWAG